MLVLTRKVGEKVVINDEIEVTVLKIQGKSISLGIKAPRGVDICRSELKEGTVELELTEPVGIG